MRINFVRHDCGVSNIIQLLSKQTPTQCPFYWKMKGGESYHGNMYYFTLLGFRLVVDTVRKKDLWVK